MIRQTTQTVGECPYCGSRKGTNDKGICKHCMADVTAFTPAVNDKTTTKRRSNNG